MKSEISKILPRCPIFTKFGRISLKILSSIDLYFIRNSIQLLFFELFGKKILIFNLFLQDGGRLICFWFQSHGKALKHESRGVAVKQERRSEAIKHEVRTEVVNQVVTSRVTNVSLCHSGNSLYS